jgi:UDP-N-acetylmuramoylalanine--D-glutamate ligase
MEFRGKRVMVLGMGVSGLAAARLLSARGAHLVMVDRRTDIEREKLPPGELRLGSEDPRWLAGVELVVTSPGVPCESAILREASAARIPVVGELELASRFVASPIVAITGTNGKSTVTTLVGEILKTAGMKTFVGGNLGTPLAEAVGTGYDAAVIEVSSFQLESIRDFKPHVGVYLNLTEDHLDRYRGLADYGRAKARLFMNQDSRDWAILNRGDEDVWKLAREVRSRVMSFALFPSDHVPAIWSNGGKLVFDDGARRATIALEGFKLPGRHNLVNAMASAAATLAMGVEPTVIERTFAAFAGLAHRLETVYSKRGVTFVDDSKGTNVGAVVEALAAVKAPVILIAGGMDKGGDYAPLRKPLEKKVRLLILIGSAREKMRAALEGATEIEVVPTLADAVRHADSIASEGDTVLLSPACSSFDQFKDYAERGRVFKELVRAL